MSAPTPILDLLIAANFAPNKTQARQLVQQGGVKLNDEPVKAIDAVIPAQDGILSVGRRKFIKLTNGN